MDETEVKYEGREHSVKERLDFVEGVLVGALKLLGRARYGEEKRGNYVTIAAWLRAAATHMDVLAERCPKPRERERE
ncbi:hypothetical protein [Paraburkholderia sp. C35]|uniref:hypothetical protein n=1 Tax=Paraburkholderia sp. C35 TaxID=2126993 RepID=UPI0013A5A503|nr:hypothetical protein [Paraburkholderia sp. C35]